MEIKVTGCKDCPFKVLDINDECVGADSLEYCQLKRKLSPGEPSKIRVYDSWYEDNIPELVTPDWCPLTELRIIKNGLE